MGRHRVSLLTDTTIIGERRSRGWRVCSGGQGEVRVKMGRMGARGFCPSKTYFQTI
jgi:hypothetical protein